MNKEKPIPLITIGKLGASFGVRGWIKIYSETRQPKDIFAYPNWLLSRGAKQHTHTTVKIESWKAHHGKFIAKFANVETPEDASKLTGMLIQIPRTELPAPSTGEYYWVDLIGLTVIDQHGANLGKVTGLMETGANDVLIVKGSKEHAIPYTPGVIEHVDLNDQKIHVNWEII